MLTKVLPFTVNGRSPAELMTGGGGPPRSPVKVWTLSIKRQYLFFKCFILRALDNLPPVVGVAASVAAGVLAGADTVTVTGAGQESPDAVSVVVGAAAAVGAALDADAALPDEIPATAAVISSAVASSTKRFCVKIQPSTSSATSQVFPAPVGSLT